MYLDGMDSVRFAVCNTDSKSLSASPVPTKIMLGKSGLGAGADPEVGRKEAESNIDEIRELFDDNTKMVFVTAAMGGGTGTGAGPLVAKVSREMGKLTIGIVTIPFYFERRPKIIKALKGLDEMRSNVDALLIINNEQISKVYCDSHISVDEALKMADNVMGNAVRSISELITLDGKIQVDFADVKTTMTNGGGAIMAIGRASGEHRVRNAVLDALNSPLLYGADISKATRVLLNIYTSSAHELYVDELEEIDAFMDELDSNIDVIWGMAKDDTLDEDAKITILATGFDNSIPVETKKAETTDDYNELIDNLYGRNKRSTASIVDDTPFTVIIPEAPESSQSNNVAGNDDCFITVGNDIDQDQDQDEEHAIANELSEAENSKEPEISETPETPEIPETSEIQETQETQEIHDTPETSETPEDPKEPESTYEDPAKNFLNRVKARIINGLLELTKVDE